MAPVPSTTQAQLVSLIYEHQSVTFENALRAFETSFSAELWGDLLQCLRQLLQARYIVWTSACPDYATPHRTRKCCSQSSAC